MRGSRGDDHPGANPGGQRVADESHSSGNGQYDEVIRGDRVQQASSGFDAGDAGAESDRGDDNKPSAAFGLRRVQDEGNAERHRGQGIAEVVNQVRKERNAAARDKRGRLQGSRDAQHPE